MGKTVEWSKDAMTDLVYSPDDGGYYFERVDFTTERTYTSAGIFGSEPEAMAALKGGNVRWENAN
jgi:hypothetical protein